MTQYDLVTTGFLNGASYRHYRMVDAAGNPLPQRDGYIDIDLADRYVLVGGGTVPVAGTTGLPFGGWVDTVYKVPGEVWGTRTSLDFTDAQWVENGQQYYYIVTAIGSNTDRPEGINESESTGEIEVSATPQAGIDGGPRIYVLRGDDFGEIGRVTSGAWFTFEPALAGATGTITWDLLDESDQPVPPPAGLLFDAASGRLSGNATSTPPPTRLRWRATAENGTATRDFMLNSPAWTPTGGTTRPEPPTNVTATAGDGYVHLSWSASPTPGVVGYRVYRSEVPRAQQRRRVYLDPSQPAAVKDDYLYFSLRGTQVDPMTSHPRVRKGRIGETWRYDPNLPDTTLRRVSHQVTVPAEMLFPGETCMEMRTPYRGLQEIGGPYIFYPSNGRGEAEWYSQLEPGRTYRFEVWMRQSGLGNGGRVELGFNTFNRAIRHEFTVDDEWRLHGFEFTAPERSTAGASHSSPVLRFTGPGTLWFDNIRLFRYDTPEQIAADFTPSPLVFGVLMASQPPTGEKGILRSMKVLLNPGSMAGNLSHHRDASVTTDWYQSVDPPSNMTVPFFLDYAFRTGTSSETRMKPWLNVSSFVSEEEWLMLIEYLAAPIDPSDPADVAAKPWAHLRYQQRGVATPWTDEFSSIRIEFANETWHNRRVENQWTGWGPAFAVHQGAREFGLVARYITEYVRDNSPYWSAAHADGKLVWVMGSNYADYGETARPATPLVGAVGHTTYVGPLWEEGEEPLGTYDDHGVQATLLGYPNSSEPRFRDYRRYREQLAAQGHDYQILGYEGGPSGYALPNSGASPDAVEYAERYGKSLAMAVAALDAWLGAYQYGFTDQGYLSFGQGSHWNSHSTIPHGFNPHVPWLGLVMRNRYVAGPMIQANVVQTPTISWDGEERPLIGAYAFRNGKQLAVFLLSRKLGGVHDGVDFGDGSTPVTLSLPAVPTGPATLYRLEGDPRATNRTALMIDIQESPATLARETTIVLPEGSIYLYVVDTDLPDRTDPPAQPARPDLTYTSAGTTLTWPAVTGATGYTILRSRHPYFERAQESAVFTSTTPSFTDEGGVGGTTFYYRIATTNGWGTGYPSLVAVGGTNPNEALLPAPELAAIGEGDGALLVAWDAVPGASGYRVGHGTTSGGPYTWTDARDDELSRMLTGLTNGTHYHVTVVAYGAAGCSPEAMERTGVPVAAGQEVILAGWDAAGLVYLGDTPDDATTLPVSRRQLALRASQLKRGPGLRTETGTYGFDLGEYDGAFPIIPVEDGGNFGADPAGSLDNAISRALYLSVTLTPEPEQVLSLTSLEGGLFYRYRERTLNVALRYRVGTGSWTTLDSPQPAITAGTFTPTDFAFPLSGLAALQGLTEPVELRLYIYHTGPEARWHPAGVKRTTAEDILVRGTSAAVNVPPLPPGEDEKPRTK
jgi:hypothetical protein